MEVMLAKIKEFLRQYPETHWQHGKCFDFASTHCYDFLTAQGIPFTILAGLNGDGDLVHAIVDIPATGTTWDSLGAQARERWETATPAIVEWLPLGTRLA